MVANATSTNMNSSWMLSLFTPPTMDPNGDPIIDVYNNNMRKAINSLTVSDSDTYTAGQKLPCIAYKKTGSTTSYWMIGLISGILHPYKSKGGDNINIPNIASIQASIESGTNTSSETTYSTQQI